MTALSSGQPMVSRSCVLTWCASTTVRSYSLSPVRWLFGACSSLALAGDSGQSPWTTSSGVQDALYRRSALLASLPLGMLMVILTLTVDLVVASGFESSSSERTSLCCVVVRVGAPCHWHVVLCPRRRPNPCWRPIPLVFVPDLRASERLSLLPRIMIRKDNIASKKFSLSLCFFAANFFLHRKGTKPQTANSSK